MAVYQKALLTYLDVLGFSDLIQTGHPDEILRVLSATKRKGKAVKSGSTTHNSSVQNFSDLIVRINCVSDEAVLPTLLKSELETLATIQCELTAFNRILLRGGVSLGDLYFDGEFMFGPALVKSHQLGEQVAVFPRIVVDSTLVTQTLHCGFDKEWQWHLQRGEDGAYFIDYLQPLLTSTREFHEKLIETLIAHKTTVEEKLIALSSRNERTKQKALWMAMYHTATFKHFEKHVKDHPWPFVGLDLATLRIKNELMAI